MVPTHRVDLSSECLGWDALGVAHTFHIPELGEEVYDILSVSPPHRIGKSRGCP